MAALKDLADKLEAQIAEFEATKLAFDAKKLGQVKSELDAFLKKKVDVVAKYEDAYPGLLRAWELQHKEVKAKIETLRTLYDEGELQKLFDEKVCPTRARVAAASDKLAILWAGRGKNEYGLHRATRALDASRATLDGLIANAKGVGDVLAANQKLLAEIDEAITPSQDLAPYIMWFLLLPAHLRIAPQNRAMSLRDEKTPAQLCPPDATEKPTDERDKEGGHEAPPSVPRLIDPKDFAGEIDKAWLDYKAKKDAYGEAESAFATSPDDFLTVTKILASLKKDEDATIRGKIVDE